MLCSIFLTNESAASDIRLACQVEKSGGLNWEGGRWVLTSFRNDKFTLIQSEQTLTAESVTKAAGYNPKYSILTSCQVTITGENICSMTNGTFLFFSPQTLKGGLSWLTGSVTNEERRDSINVSAFSCTLL